MSIFVQSFVAPHTCQNLCESQKYVTNPFASCLVPFFSAHLRDVEVDIVGCSPLTWRMLSVHSSSVVIHSESCYLFSLLWEEQRNDCSSQQSRLPH